MFIYSFPRPVTLLVEFEGVDDVLPDAVEAAVRHGGDRPGERDECRDLERKHKEMPFPESEVVREDRVELEEQHRGTLHASILFPVPYGLRLLSLSKHRFRYKLSASL